MDLRLRGSKQIIATNCPKGHCWAAAVSKSAGSRPALVLQKPRAQKRNKGLIHPLKVATEGRGGLRKSVPNSGNLS